MFEKRGVDIVAMFDVNPELIGKTVGGVTVYSMEKLEEFCGATPVDLAVLTLPKDQVKEASCRLSDVGVRGLWNLTGQERDFLPEDVVVENVHLGDSLMILDYLVCKKGRELRENADEPTEEQ